VAWVSPGDAATGFIVRIQLASDLHLEFLERMAPQARLVLPAPGADLLVLAGDIHNGVKGIEAFADWPVPVVYLAGNHEFYDHDWESTRQDLRAACAGTQVTFLDNDSIEFKGVRILGCTLWTDFRLGESRQTQAMEAVERGLMDYHVIRTASGPLRARQTLADHEKSRSWLEGELAKPFDGKTVVVTHHGPHPLSIHPRFADNALNPGFISDLTPLLRDADLWLHGHTHDGFDYRIGRCRVVANPAGYILNRAAATTDLDFKFENGKFDPGLVVDVGP
jgi:DNA repair exonuclease SbcCD nuclease subunit